MVDTTILNDVVQLVNEDRQNDYGPPRDNLGRIAALWSAYLRTDISPEDVSVLMALVKIARMKGGYKRDNAVDGVAYLLLADMFGRYDATK